MKFNETGLPIRALHLFQATDCAPWTHDREAEIDVVKFAAIVRVRSLKGVYSNIGKKTLAEVNAWLRKLQARCEHYWTGNPLACRDCGKLHRNDNREHYP